MNQQPLVEQQVIGSTLGLTVFLGVFLFSGIILIVTGIICNKRKKVGLRNTRRELVRLLNWGIIGDAEIEQASGTEQYTAENLSADQLSARIIQGSPTLQEFLLNWSRPWGGANIGAGVGMLLAAAISAALIRVSPLTMSMTLAQATSHAILLLTLSVATCLLGLCCGLGLGFFIAVSRAAVPPEQQPPRAELHQRHIADYRSSLMGLLPFVLLVIDSALALGSAMTSPRITSEEVVALVGVVPALEFVLLLLDEYLMRRAVRLPPLHLSSDLNLAERANRKMPPRMIQIFFTLQCLTVATFAFCQLLLVPELAERTTHRSPIPVLLWLIPALVLLFVAAAHFLHGRFGGRKTGWPWSQNEEIEREAGGSVQP